MKQLLLLSGLLLMLNSCAGRKQIEKQIHSGNYDVAIQNALQKLERNKHKKRKQDYIVLLKNAYQHVLDADFEKISRLKKENNPEYYETIFNLYQDLDTRQKSVKSVLPLQIDGKTLVLDFYNFSDDIIDYREKVSLYKYNEALSLLNSDSKLKNRKAFETLQYIEQINPNYKDVRSLTETAHEKGIDYILVGIENQTHQLIPKQLEYDLLNFNAYDLDDFWTIYHSNANTQINYDYEMVLQLNTISVSPEQIKEKQVLRKKNIVDGWEYVLDENGNVKKDSLGNDIKQDKIITAKARFFEFNQFKSTQVVGRVSFFNLKQQQELDNFPIKSEFVFENTYAKVRGDKRALNENDIELLKQSAIQFPTNEQMVYDTGEDLKHKLKRIITQFSFS